jgi:hypothetical protein
MPLKRRRFLTVWDDFEIQRGFWLKDRDFYLWSGSGNVGNDKAEQQAQEGGE